MLALTNNGWRTSSYTNQGISGSDDFLGLNSLLFRKRSKVSTLNGDFLHEKLINDFKIFFTQVLLYPE